MKTEVPLQPSQAQTQVEYWNGINGEVWAREADITDPRLEQFGQAAIAALAPRAGERILDVGCGAGATSRALARLVGSTGQVVGADISRPLLDVARARAGGPSYVEADAGKAIFDVPFDAIFSRFGVMFFEQPSAAFAHLRRAAPGGRIAFVCWRSPEENFAMTQPLALVKHLFPEEPPSDPDAPGPFALADGAKLRRLLEEAGWRDLAINRHDTDYMLGASPAEAVRYVTTIGPLARAIRAHPERRDEAFAVLDGFFSGIATRPIALPATVWIVTAKA